jgi:uncharacterized protein
MTISPIAPIAPLVGGALIGLAATLLLWSHGKIAGISGLYGGLLAREVEDRGFRISFLTGLLLGGVGLLLARPAVFGAGSPVSLPYVAVAGLLVGFGTRLGNGCTSGHGVCGISRLSGRSMAATVTFMLTGFVTVFLTHHVFVSSSLGAP